VRADRRAIVRIPCICLVTAGLAPERPVLDVIVEAARAGVDLVQIRERRLDDRALIDLTRRAVDATRDLPVRIVLNDRFDVALAAGASGVHLRGQSPPAARVRAAAPEGFLVGRSVHDLEEAVAVEAAGGCDYLVFGTVFPSSSKRPGHPASGIEALRAVCRSVQLPVLAIGGISIETVPAIRSAGASGIAAIGLFQGGDSIADTVRKVRRQFDT
jgi:thiamine-phosphate pyrophosphorylase